MLYTYPSNRLENLVVVLNTLLTQLNQSPLATDQVLVQHPGMQHWLSMELAKHSRQRICMNIRYPLPVRYFWDLIRLILGKDAIPERSVYSREILAWRIYQQLAEPGFINDVQAVEPSHYWQAQPPHLQARRRFQLAEQLADLFEQYLMFRPSWVEQWQSGDTPHWQAKLWQRLVAQNPNHPLALMKQAMHRIQQPQHTLPEQFYIFGINALAPIWLDFLSALARQSNTDIHLLYLNPSAEQWDELGSEKQQIRLQVKQARQRSLWVTDDSLAGDAGNPLLTSLGYQGQAFVRLLSERADHDTEVFTSADSNRLLQKIQNDMLTLSDRRQAPLPAYPDDGSIQVTSAHSAFREVQGLHDWLLHQFNEDATLTPKDVLVMCPNVEDYAPFVQAVFARSFADMADDVPPLPCSIADRNLKNADPTVAAFLELLTLPDARFAVNQIISWLRVPAIADKFALSAGDLKKIERWLLRANVHWGFSAEHKQQWLPATETSQHFTWQQGLDRLLLGFSFADQDSFVNQQMLLHDVEGEDAQLLGRLSHILHQLHDIRSSLHRSRTPAQWQAFLQEQLRQVMFSSEAVFERSNQALQKVINDLTEFANKADLAEVELPLPVIRQVLDNAFASPEQTGSQFMTGQITVCSMVPMRSIPFRVIAILGLNDGQFPRTRPPLGFDLMAQDRPRLGDRSRRGDDRYLFLEALLSARDALYLSYQGADIRKNDARPASLVLEEFLDYLNQGYGFERSQHLRQLPLQPFSQRNYLGAFPTFEPHWQRLQNTQITTPDWPLTNVERDTNHYALEDWIDFFSHPSRYFARNRLGLFLEPGRNELDDSEPFALTHLHRYQVQEQHIRAGFDAAVDDFHFQQAMAASQLPLAAQTEAHITSWQQAADDFIDALRQAGFNNDAWQPVQVTLAGCILHSHLPARPDGRQIFWRAANCKGHDVVALWLRHLLANAKAAVTSLGYFRGKNDSIEQLCLPAIEASAAKAELQALYPVFLRGQNQPLLYNPEFLLNCLREQNDASHFNKVWANDWQQQGLAFDPYVQYFWHQVPDFQETMTTIEQLYLRLIAELEISTVDGGIDA